ncbi:MAG: hypothetical protein IPK07_23855 [Deltaproteobacteria bacterium]|nr:hypothetical protein [Deltaproteobacteria bacterium]
MQETHGPLCFAALEVRDVAPCADCGHDPAELAHLARGRRRLTPGIQDRAR